MKTSTSKITVIFADIDTPVPGQPFYKKTRSVLRKLVLRKSIKVIAAGNVATKSKIKGKVYLGKMDVGAELVRQGYAWPKKDAPMDSPLIALQKEAKNEEKGFWSDPDTVSPSEWKKKKEWEKGFVGTRPTVKKKRKNKTIAKNTLSKADLRIKAIKKKSTIEGTVVNVLEGDYFRISVDELEVDIRLVGVDAPDSQTKQPYSLEAKQALSDMIIGKTVTIKTHNINDLFDVVVSKGPLSSAPIYGSVYLGATFINEEMLKRGLAWAEAMNTRYPVLNSAMRFAIESENGLWSTDGLDPPVPPWIWINGESAIREYKIDYKEKLIQKEPAKQNAKKTEEAKRAIEATNKSFKENELTQDHRSKWEYSLSSVGNNLYGSSWASASYKNKLATAADFVADAKKADTMPQLRERSELLVKCLNEATSDPDLVKNETLSDVATMCMVMMGW